MKNIHLVSGRGGKKVVVFCNQRARDYTNYLSKADGTADDYTAGGAGFGTIEFTGQETKKQMLKIVLK